MDKEKVIERNAHLQDIVGSSALLFHTILIYFVTRNFRLTVVLFACTFLSIIVFLLRFRSYSSTWGEADFILVHFNNFIDFLCVHYVCYLTGLYRSPYIFSLAGYLVIRTVFPKYKIERSSWLIGTFFTLVLLGVLIALQKIPAMDVFAANLSPQMDILISGIITGFNILIVFYLLNDVNENLRLLNNEVERERNKSEKLLLNILPGSIADRLLHDEIVIADRFDSASVLFLDIVDFTKMSCNMPASEVVDFLNALFSRFDTLTDEYGLEKIKTIGDAYMAVSGIPVPASDHARRTANIAIAMLKELNDYSIKKDLMMQARIGICSGPVVAGVIGKKRFIYDLWGDTVNTASRMESFGIPNKIQVTQATYDILKDDYIFDFRGQVDIKGKGKMKTYFLLEER
jgi:class 3 adenylate cyclase